MLLASESPPNANSMVSIVKDLNGNQAVVYLKQMTVFLIPTQIIIII